METNKLDDNFEKLKQSMLEKKLKAEALNKNVDVHTDVHTDVNKNTNTSIDKDVNKNIYIDDDIDVYTNVHKNTNISDYNDVNKDVNKFVIRPKECEQTPVRYTMYLKPDTIEKISHYSKLLNLGKSEFAQKIFEYFLNNIEIIEWF